MRPQHKRHKATMGSWENKRTQCARSGGAEPRAQHAGADAHPRLRRPAEPPCAHGGPEDAGKPHGD